MILGWGHPAVAGAPARCCWTRARSFGAPTAAEVELARLICAAVPSVELVRMVNSGTEATMSAVRVARGFTERDKVVKFAGCYHGHADAFLAAAGSGVLTLALPDSPGVTARDHSRHPGVRVQRRGGAGEVFRRSAATRSPA